MTPAEPTVLVLEAHCEACGLIIDGLADVAGPPAPESGPVETVLTGPGVTSRGDLPMPVPVRVIYRENTCMLCGGRIVFALAGGER